MRRILNLNQPGTVFLKMIGIFIVVIPAVLYCTIFLLSGAEIAIVLCSLIKVSFAVGASGFVILLVLITVEQIQDYYIDVQYQKNRARKLALANGNYECQYCGNQKVKENEKTCQICGKKLKQAG